MLSIFQGSRPDITPAQVAAALVGGVPIVANLLHAFGVFTISQEEQDALTESIKYAVGAGGLLVLADAHLRGQRGKAEATVKAAGINAAATAKQNPVTTAPEAPPAADTPESDEHTEPPVLVTEPLAPGAIGATAGDPPTRPLED